MSNLSQAERDNLPASSFADPEGRRYPILDGEDVESAVKLLGKAGDAGARERVKRGIIRRAKAIGASGRLPRDWMGGGKSLDMLILPGSPVKALGSGRIGGVLALFTAEGDYDRVGDRFSPATDFDLDVFGRVPILSEHGFGPLKRRRLGIGELSVTPEGIAIDGKLDLRDDAERSIYAKAEAGAMFWSSGSAGHRVDREAEGEGGGSLLTSWPIIEASLTETPAEPRAMALSIKSLAPPDDTDPEAEPTPAGPCTLESQADAALAAVKAFGDRLKVVSEMRADQGRTISPARREAIKAVMDELALLHAGTAPPLSPLALKLRLLALAHGASR